MTRPQKTLRAAIEEMLTDIDGNEYEHVEGCDGEDTCPACWVQDIRARLAAHPVGAASRVHVAVAIGEVLYGGAVQTAVQVGYTYRLADSLLAARVFRDEATVKAEAVEEFVATAGIWPDSAQVTIGTVREQAAKHVAGLRGKAAW